MGFYSIETGYTKDRNWRLVFVVVLVITAVAILSFTKLRQPKPNAVLSQPVAVAEAEPAKQAPQISTPIPWPQYGQAAYGVAGNGVMAASKPPEPVPVASLAKVITALAVLKQKPLAVGEQGPLITITQKDIDLYTQYVAKSGAVVPIKLGEQISQYQAIQAMLMPSANNISDSLAAWAFGSQEAYNAYANQMVRELGLTDTTIADASGFSPQTKSTAQDMVQLGILYMQNPVLRGIITQTEAQIPFAGIIRNYNAVENQGGVKGIKVGDTDEAGRCFLVADIEAGTNKVTSVTAVIGAPDLPTAIKDAKIVLSFGNIGYDSLPKY